MRALLDHTLSKYDLTFPQWTILVFSATSLPLEDLIEKQRLGFVVASPEESLRSLNSLIERGYIANGGNLISQTAAGAGLFAHLSSEVGAVTQTLFADLPESDVETTVRVLNKINERARALLSSEA